MENPLQIFIQYRYLLIICVIKTLLGKNLMEKKFEK